MRLTIVNDTGYNATVMTAEMDCNTDGLPLMPRVVFWGVQTDPTSAMAALAAACVFHKYCGDQVDFPGVKLGSNHSFALRTLIGSDVNVSPVHGAHNTLTELTIDMMVHPQSAPLPQMTDSRRAARQIAWGGDFVDATTRSSSEVPVAPVHTNARLVADDLYISAAIGLLAGAGRLRNLYLSAEAAQPKAQKLHRALAEAGVNTVFS